MDKAFEQGNLMGHARTALPGIEEVVRTCMKNGPKTSASKKHVLFKG